MKQLFLFLLLLSTNCFGQTSTKVSEKEFQKELELSKMQFEMPKNFKATPILSNDDLWYGFAIKHNKEDFEIRYTVWPLASTIEDYERCLKDTNCTMVNPNRIYEGRIQANVLNMTGGNNPEIAAFNPDAVWNEFKADNGGTSFFALNCEFGKGYQYGQMIYLHKDNVADVIITYLSNDLDVHSALMDEAFHALVFR